jgi:hypothetical protein
LVQIFRWCGRILNNRGVPLRVQMWRGCAAVRYMSQPASSAFQLPLFIVTLFSILIILYQRDPEMESAMDEREDGRSASLVPRQSGGEAAIRIIRLPSLSFQHESKQKPQPCEVCGDFDEKAFDKPRKTELHRLLGSSRAGCASCLLTCHIIDLQWHALAREQGEQLGRLPSDILERLDALNKELHRYPHVVELRMSVTGYLSVKTHSKYRFEGHHYCLTYIFAGPGKLIPFQRHKHIRRGEAWSACPGEA